MKIQIRRVYEEPKPSDGLRVLVDRLWPRGLAKNDAALDVWAKEIAPSDELRRWFEHDVAKFDEFKRRYLIELGESIENTERLLTYARGRSISLLYAAKDTQHNNAVVCRSWLQCFLKNTDTQTSKRDTSRCCKGSEDDSLSRNDD